jgi:hypothetical protein
VLFASAVVAVLAAFWPWFAWQLAKSVDILLESALDGAGANMSISVECDRSPIGQNREVLRVTVKLVKGDRGSVDLRDAKGRVLSADNSELLSFELGDIVRLNFDSDKPIVLWEPNNERGQIRLAPGGTMEMAAHCRVAAGEVYKIEVVVLGSVLNVFQPWKTPKYWVLPSRWRRLVEESERRAAEDDKKPVFSQWRASHVSLPLESNEEPKVNSPRH